ncbi:MAG: hypothetical protein ACRYG8_23290 [Janthinobacterium lividum]
MSSIEKEEKQSASLPIDDDVPIEGETLVNVSGHIQEVDRNFGFWSICAIGVVADNAWGAGGGALVTALYNGGSPGVLYGLIAATFFYVFIGASLAELASAIPSSANVYHWASVTAGPKYGKYSFPPNIDAKTKQDQDVYAASTLGGGTALLGYLAQLPLLCSEPVS